MSLHRETDNRYLVGLDFDGVRWIEIKDWPQSEFQSFKFEYDVDVWPDDRFDG